MWLDEDLKLAGSVILGLVATVDLGLNVRTCLDVLILVELAVMSVPLKGSDFDFAIGVVEFARERRKERA